MSTLERAIAIAAEAHAGQKDKAGAPYILHPLRVMQRVSSMDEKVVAVLHDVCEDCAEWDLERLKGEGFSQQVIAALAAVTRRENEEYETFVRRASTDPIGKRVKLADLLDNCDLSRIADPTHEDRQRIEKYRAAIALIEQDCEKAGVEQR